MGVGSAFDKWGGRGSTVVTFWPFMAASGVAGVITAYLSKGVTLVNQYGAFGWWCAGLTGCLATALTLFLASIAWERAQRALSIKSWSKGSDTFNPLDGEFKSLRVDLNKLRSPYDSFVERKVFVDCELIGPATIALISGHYNDLEFINCDYVVITKGTKTLTALGFKDCTIRGCKIVNSVVIMPQEMFDKTGLGLTANVLNR